MTHHDKHLIIIIIIVTKCRHSHEIVPEYLIYFTTQAPHKFFDDVS